MSRSLLSAAITVVILASCASSSKVQSTSSTAPVSTATSVPNTPEVPKESSMKQSYDSALNAIEEEFQDHVGFALYDPLQKEMIYHFKGDRYFTPGSNTKIFTFYTSLRMLRDSVPALRYTINRDSLIFWGTGDPSLLYKNVFTNTRVFDFLKKSKKPLYFSNANFNTSYFGSGWAWDDYNDYYSTERSPFPIYGNIFWMEITRNSTLVKPKYFRQFQQTGARNSRPKIERELQSNAFTYYPSRRADTLDIPFHIDEQLITNLLADTLKRRVTPITKKLPHDAAVLYSMSPDSLYKVMMQESDNFIAEQLLLICSGIVSDTLQPEIAIDYSLNSFLSDLSDKPIWVDGSGLSRYNLFAPRTIVQLWEKIYNLVPREKLLPLLATGGKSGTIKNWYKADSPFIFGKTGTLSNNHCLSGFLLAKSGRLFIFSFMNNNYVAKTSAVREEMQKILKTIYDTY